jgi:hypothetical protein
VVLKISYGYDVASENDSLVALADKANEEFSESMRPGAFLVDLLPWSSLHTMEYMDKL